MPSTEPFKLPFAPRVDSAVAWLEALPVENSRERCRKLYAGLQALNASGLEPGVHYRILERMRPMVELESGKLLSAFAGMPLPLGERLRRSAKLSAQFQAELAKGFQSVVSGEHVASEFPADEWARLVQRALSAYEQYLLRLALMYELASPSLWSRINALYRMAEHYGFAGRDGSGIGEAFVRMQTFRLACPNRLDQDDVQRLHALLQTHGAMIDLKSESTTGDTSGEFIADLKSGEPPVPVSVGRPPESQHCRFLNAGRFRRQLSRQMQTTVPERERLTADFAVRVLVRLGGSPPYSLEQKGRQAMCVHGLDSIFGMVLKAEQVASGNVWTTGLGQLELVPLSDHLGIRPHEESSKSAGTFSAESSGRKPVKPATGGGIWGRPEGEFPCQVFRSEVPGFYVLETGNVALHPGKLLALNTDNKLIQVGLVGAARPRGSGGLSVFELLANEVDTVRVFGASVSAPYTALFAQSARQGCGTLLGPPIKLRNGDVVELDRSGRRQSYRIARLLESTAEFTQFELAPPAHKSDKG